jgi:hypothetical protein
MKREQFRKQHQPKGETILGIVDDEQPKEVVKKAAPKKKEVKKG